MLRGTIRDHTTQQRRPFIRFFACGQDLSLERRTPRCPTRSRWAQSLFWLWGHGGWPSGRAASGPQVRG